jgi:hypothetical protein
LDVEHRDDLPGQLVLNLQDVVGRSIPTFGPAVLPGLGVDQLSVDADPIRLLTEAAFNQVARA